MTQTVFPFGPGFEPTPFDTKEILGGKGFHLARMSQNGIPVPEGFTLSTELGKGDYFIPDHIYHGLNIMEWNPDAVLLSVRSGSPVSMPGMMDTVLNVGIFRNNFQEFAEVLGIRTAFDCYRRFLQMFANVVYGVSSELFESVIMDAKLAANVENDFDLIAPDLADICVKFEDIYEDYSIAVPSDLGKVLIECSKAVFDSWDSERAIAYREVNNISDTLGTAVNIQRMVFGNMNDKSASGVLFTRNPATGERKVTGEFLVNAQGEDVVAGIRTPSDLFDLDSSLLSELLVKAEELEKLNGDMQDIEFTIEDGKLWILQTRNGQRSGAAKFKIAHDLYEEGLIELEEALTRVDLEAFNAVKVPVISPGFQGASMFIGMPASPGIATGVVVRSSKDALTSTEPCILLTKETNPDDFPGMAASVGILTEEGGITSHAAVVARGMNKAAVVGAGDLSKIETGSVISIDGTSGQVWDGEVPVDGGVVTPETMTMLNWAFEQKDMLVSFPVVIDGSKPGEEIFEDKVNDLPKKGYVSLNLSAVTHTLYTGVYKFMNTLKNVKGLSGVIDLTMPERLLGDGDLNFMASFGVTDTSEKCDAEVLRKQVKGLLSNSMTLALKKRWKIKLEDGYAKHKVELSEAGWSVVQEMTEDQAGHINALGLTITEFVQAVAAIGKPIYVTPKPVPFDQALFEVLS